MTYYESAENIKITLERAFEELRKHDCTEYEEFLKECGKKEFYDAKEVLHFLGY